MKSRIGEKKIRMNLAQFLMRSNFKFALRQARGVNGQVGDFERIMGFSTPKEKMVADSDIDYTYFAGVIDISYSRQRDNSVYLCAFLIYGR